MRNIRSYFYLTLAMTIVGSSLVVGKIITNSFPVFLASGLSLFVASIVFFPFLIKAESGIPQLGKKDLTVIILQALLGTFIYRILLLYGLKYANAAEGGIITSSTSAVIAILSFLLLKEKLKLNKIIGVVFSVLGVLAINLTVDFHNSTQNNTVLLGVLLIFASVIAEALFSVLAKFVSNKVKPLTMAALITIFSFLMFLPFAIVEGMRFNFGTPTIYDWVSVLYYGLFVTVISFSLWFKGLSMVEASTAGIFLGVVPVSSVFLSYLILKEPFSWYHIIGSILVVIGITFISKEPIYETNK